MRARGNPRTSESGFTLVELAIVIAVVAILAAVTITSFSRAKPRADMKTAAADLQAMIHQARETALATGTPVAVLVYTGYAPAGSGIGYFIVYQDACTPSFDFFNPTGSTCGVSYSTYNPAVLAVGSNATSSSVVIDTMSLPNDVMIGPSNGAGSSATLQPPLKGVAINVACSFCGTTGGAVEFDASGVATFFQLSGSTVTPLLANGGGGSLSLTYNSAVTDVTGQKTIVIFSASGAVQVFGTG